MSLKVAIVSHIYPTQQAPARATFIRNEVRLLADHLQIEIYLPSVFSLPFQKQYYRSRRPDEDQVPIHRFSYVSIPRRRLPLITRRSISSGLLKAVREQDPNLVHLHWAFPCGMAAPTLKAAGYPVVITIHGGDWYTNIDNLSLLPLLKESMEASDGLICVGKQLFNDISEKLPGLKDKLHHIPHGIDTNLFKPAEDKSSVKEQLNWREDKFHLLSIANLYYEKGLDLLVEALAGLNSYPCHLHIVSANQQSGEKSRVDNIIRENNLQNQITFHPQLPQKDLVPYLQAADVLVSPSRKEGFGLVVAEAIACGTPVLVTRSGGPEEIVTAETGLLVEPDNPHAIKLGLEELLMKLDQFHSSKLHAEIEERFSQFAKLKKMLKLYESITNDSEIKRD